MGAKPAIYLNNAATGYPKPPTLWPAIQKYLHHLPPSSQRSGGRDSHDVAWECRQKLAALFHAPAAEQIVFTSGATESLNLAILGVGFKNTHIITTNTEHNSVLRPLKKIEAEGLIQLTVVDCNGLGQIAPAAIAAAFRDNTGAVIINHCSNVTGRVIALKPIAALAHAAGALFIVDAAQSAGVYPLHVVADGIDMLAFTGHKSLHGVPGIGGLYIKPGLWPTPLKIGGTGVKSQLLTQPRTMPLYYEAGTPNSVGIVSLMAGIDFILATGMEKIREHKENMVTLFYQELKDVPGVVFYGIENALPHTTVICFNITGLATEDLGYMLEHSFNIMMRTGLHCAPLIHKPLGSHPDGSVRLSPSYFTTPQEITQASAAIKEICAAVTGDKT